ncbi:MAG TPA: DNA repair protein RadA [Desulfobacterales bacterium]|nr:DNA repair protein RadA [Desulfobacterales bacterium]
MPKPPKRIFLCQQCGYQSLKWLGRCPDCGQWNSLVETRPMVQAPASKRGISSPPQSISSISSMSVSRLKSHIEEFDRTLGGGLVPGSLILVGGEPGIGKSTLILQVLDCYARSGLKVLYVTGEESLEQVKLRAERLSVTSEHLFVMAETLIEEILGRAEELSPNIVAVDSIQTMQTEAISSVPGSISQVREGASLFLSHAKATGTSIFLIGHVTKEGAIAGPKLLEHMVDTVLYFEGDTAYLYRVLRAVKNRYGSTNEIGVFEMTDQGLQEVVNPSSAFLAERAGPVAGSVVVPYIEGTRPILVEIQALVGPSPFGVPRRTAVGVDPNRISLLVAVLGKRMGMEIGDQDIFINVAGGLRLQEPACDLGIIAALMSSYLNKPVDQGLILFGEVGLGGEVRGAPHPRMRLKEAEKLGFSRCILSNGNLGDSRDSTTLELFGIDTILDLSQLLFG